MNTNELTLVERMMIHDRSVTKQDQVRTFKIEAGDLLIATEQRHNNRRTGSGLSYYTAVVFRLNNKRIGRAKVVALLKSEQPKQ